MIVLYPNADSDKPMVHVTADIAETAGSMIARAIAETILRHGRCRLALSGGPAVRGVCNYLRQHLAASVYPNLWITFTDERRLPVTDTTPGNWQAFDPASNLYMACDAWLAHVPTTADRVAPMDLGGPLETEIVRFGRQFQRTFEGDLDVAVLSMGHDGSIGALLPDHPALQVEDVCLGVHDSPEPPAQRLGLALTPLRKASYLFVLASGLDKADALLRAWHGDQALPLAHLHGDGDVHWIADGAAGQALARAELDGMRGVVV